MYEKPSRTVLSFQSSCEGPEVSALDKLQTMTSDERTPSDEQQNTGQHAQRKGLEYSSERNGEVAKKCVEGRMIAFQRREARVLYVGASRLLHRRQTHSSPPIAREHRHRYPRI